MDLLNIFWWEWLWLSVEEWLLPVFHHDLNLSDVLLHLLNESVDVRDDGHALVDEWINVLGVPFEVNDTWLEGVVHFHDSVVEKWLLDW